ncbi:MAG: spermidine/putrescine ABC transporter substrate-binding protein [Acidimicrobiia bacterium]|nr:spermidine/putrescine ABC transporter substrate-binding protein [Acidimicrobiia bacterium]
MSRRQRQRLINNSISRRQFLGRAGLLTGAVALGPSVLAACGGDDDDTGGSGSGDTGGGGTPTLKISNWIEYIDEEKQLAKDAAAYASAKVDYIEDVNDNSEYFATVLQPTLSQGKSANRDGFIVTDWMASRVISLDWVSQIDRSATANLGNILDSLADPSWDPGRKFSVPWQSGMTGVAYNISKTGRELTSLEELFDPAFKGQVTFLTEMRDTVGLMMLLEGADPSDISSIDDAQGAFDRIAEAKASGQLRAFTGNEYVSDLTTGNLTAALAWSGDVLQASLEDPDIRFLIPEEGALLWSDNFLIPSSSENVAAASKWIDFFYDPVNAAQLTMAIQFVSPVQGVADELRKLGEEGVALADSPLVVPDDEALANLHIFSALDEETETAFDARFAEISGA